MEREEESSEARSCRHRGQGAAVGEFCARETISGWGEGPVAVTGGRDSGEECRRGSRAADREAVVQGSLA